MEQKRILSLNEYEHRVVVNALNSFRTHLIAANGDTMPVDDVLIKVIRAKGRGARKRSFEQAR